MRDVKRILASLVVGLALCATAAVAQTYDLVIRNGRVIDPETNLDAVRDVGISGDKIAAISEAPLQGKRTIDAAGLIVSPGFIDIHSHSFDLPGNRMQALDGVTTQLELESGILPIGKWYDAVAKEGRAINYGAAASWSFARIITMVPEMPPAEPTQEWYGQAFQHPVWTTDVSTEAQLQKIVATLEQALSEGAIAIGVNSGYTPGVGGKELMKVWETAHENNVPVSTHMRNWSQVDPLSSLEGLNMVLGMAVTTGARTNICHIHSTNLHDTPKAAEMVAAARAAGVDVRTELYPYGIFSCPVSSAPLLLQGDTFRQRMGVDFDAVRLIAKQRWIKDEADLRSEQKLDSGQMIITKFLDEDEPADEEILASTLALPWVAIASDAVPWNLPDGSVVRGDVWPLPATAVSNPRSAGTFSRFLGRFVREKNILTWPEAIRKVTLIPAQLFDGMVPAMERKGRLQVGKDADITVFDPKTIIDRATVDKPAQPSEGVRYLVVNGTVLIDKGVLDPKALPGRPIRRSPK